MSEDVDVLPKETTNREASFPMSKKTSDNACRAVLRDARGITVVASGIEPERYEVRMSTDGTRAALVRVVGGETKILSVGTRDEAEAALDALAATFAETKDAPNHGRSLSLAAAAAAVVLIGTAFLLSPETMGVGGAPASADAAKALAEAPPRPAASLLSPEAMGGGTLASATKALAEAPSHPTAMSFDPAALPKVEAKADAAEAAKDDGAAVALPEPALVTETERAVQTADSAAALLDSLKKIRRASESGQAVTEDMLKSLPTEVAEALRSTGAVAKEAEKPQQVASADKVPTRLPLHAVPRDRYGIPTVPPENTWTAIGGFVRLPLPGGGDIKTPEDMKDFGMTP